MKRITTFVLVGVLWVGTALGAETVVSTHAVLGELTEIVGGEAIEVVTLIPSGFCPSHYDLRPSDLAAVLDASVILYSGFEPWIETLADAAGSAAVVVQLPGSWSTPEAAAEKVAEIRDLLSSRFPSSKERFEENATAYLEQLAGLGERLRTKAGSLEVSEVPTVCMAWQTDFVSWLGFATPVTYGIPEGLSMRDLVELAEAGRAAGARLVIDNLQSGLDFGAKLAREIDAVHVVLSNFPGAMPGTASLAELLQRNATALFSAIEPVEATEE